MPETPPPADEPVADGGVTGGQGAPVVGVRNLSKTFGGVLALDQVSLEVRPGEVHGLLGENGSGKSTLIKVLAGYHLPDEAEIRVNGEECRPPLVPADLGLSFVHQDLGLIRELTVLENLQLVHLARSRSWRINWRSERRAAREVFARYDLNLDPDVLVDQISETDRALLAIARATEGIRAVMGAGGRGLLVLDEPTVFLPREGVERLFAIVRDVAARDASVLFVSHDLDEVREIADRVTVLRDGRNHGTVVTKEASEGELVEMIIGRRLAQLELDRGQATTEKTTVSVQGLRGTKVADLSFDVREGEVLGITGLMGSGFDEVPYLLFGARPCRGGELRMEDASYQLGSMTPERALAAGMALVPADRQRDGSVGSLPVGENVMLQVLAHYQPMRLQRRRLRRTAAGLLEEYDVRPADPDLAYQSLSGGNQQKALLAKWMQTDPRLVLLHEPTQGVDVGAREQIFRMLAAAAKGGTSFLCSSSDYEQLAVVCDRVLVIGNGKVVRELTGDEVGKDRIAEQVYNSVTLADAERVV